MAIRLEDIRDEYDAAKFFMEKGLDERRKTLALYIMMDKEVPKHFNSEANKMLLDRYKSYLEEVIASSNKEDELLRDIVDYIDFVKSTGTYTAYTLSKYPKVFEDIIVAISLDKTRRNEGFNVVSKGIMEGLLINALDFKAMIIGPGFDPTITEDKFKEYKESIPKK